VTDILAAAFVGLLSGTHVASWGMYKDAPHEGFELRKYLRSVVLGAGLGIGAGAVTPLDATEPMGFAVLFGVVYVVERALGEIYKTFFRQEDQSKYTIPMQFAVLGETVESRPVRAALGLGYLGVMLGMIALVRAYQRWAGPDLSLVETACVASAGAWISALGGAWKDAPIEGFQTLKFFRSPALAALWGLLLASLTPHLVLITLAATGYTIATTETYKSFLFPSKPRGKFAGKPIVFPALVRVRQLVLPLYFGIWLTVLMMFGFGLRLSHG
jgi:hypothetical protein